MSNVFADFRVHEKRTPANRAMLMIGEFGCRRLLMQPSGRVLHLWRIGGRVGYLETRVFGRHRWVWLHPDSLARVCVYHGPAVAGSYPELELNETKPNGRRKRALQQLNHSREPVVGSVDREERWHRQASAQTHIPPKAVPVAEEETQAEPASVARVLAKTKPESDPACTCGRCFTATLSGSGLRENGL